jgi:hypothetical protein
MLVRSCRAGLPGYVFTIDIVDLGRPEEQHDEVVTATEEGDEKDYDHGPFGFVEERPRNHRVWSIHFPYEEGDDKHDTQDERHRIVRAAPFILQNVNIAVNACSEIIY